MSIMTESSISFQQTCMTHENETSGSHEWSGDPEPGITGARATLPIRRVVGPADVAALAIHIMSNTALTGATYDIDGGQQLVS